MPTFSRYTRFPEQQGEGELFDLVGKRPLTLCRRAECRAPRADDQVAGGDRAQSAKHSAAKYRSDPGPLPDDPVGSVRRKSRLRRATLAAFFGNDGEINRLAGKPLRKSGEHELVSQIGYSEIADQGSALFAGLGRSVASAGHFLSRHDSWRELVEPRRRRRESRWRRSNAKIVP